MEGKPVHGLLRSQAYGVDWPEIIRQAVAYCHRAGLEILVVDTFSDWVRLPGDWENSASLVTEATVPLKEAAATGLAVVALAHDRKSGGTDGDNIRGSNALLGAVDIAASLSRNPSIQEPTARVLTAQSRYSSTPLRLELVRTDDRYRIADFTALGMEEERERILEFCASEAKTENEIAEQIGHSRNKTRDLLAAILDEPPAVLERSGLGVRNDPYLYRKVSVHSFQSLREDRNETNGGDEDMPF